MDAMWCSITHFCPRHEMDVGGQLYIPAALHPGEGPRYPLNRNLGSSQSRSGPLWEETYFMSLKDSKIASVILSAGTSLVSHRVLNRCECFCVVGQKSRISLHCAEGKLQLFVSRLQLVPVSYSLPDKVHLPGTGVYSYFDLNICESFFLLLRVLYLFTSFV